MTKYIKKYGACQHPRFSKSVIIKEDNLDTMLRDAMNAAGRFTIDHAYKIKEGCPKEELVIDFLAFVNTYLDSKTAL